MPIYEYRCPEGHAFERFQSITAPAPESCDVCGAEPVQLVLYPVAIHYKGSGFYTTDYGKGKTARKEGAESTPAKSESASTSSGGAATEKKTAAGGD